MSEKTPVEQYLEAVSQPAQRAALEALCAIIRAALPGAEETISYGLPAFKIKGKGIAGFAAGVKNCSYYPFSSGILSQFPEELKDYKTSKGAVQFAPEHPLPVDTLHKLIHARLEEAGISL